MILELTSAGATVREADDCTRLSLLTALPDDQLDAALDRSGAGMRAPEGNGVLLDVAALHSRARSAASAADWESRWNAMISYADSRGWLTANRTAVRAHVESAGSTAGG